MDYKQTQNLQLRQTQELVMTPQLQQAIRLLQLSRMELIDEIRNELDGNPILAEEEAEHRSRGDSPQQGAGESVGDAGQDPRAGMAERLDSSDLGKRAEDKQVQDIDWEQFLENRSMQQPVPASRGGFEELPGVEQYLTRKENLVEHLRWQLHASDFTESEQRFAEQVLNSLDENGYLDLKGSYREDITELEKGLAEDSAAKYPIFNLGVIDEKVGDVGSAERHFGRFLGLDVVGSLRAWGETHLALLREAVKDADRLPADLVRLRVRDDDGGARDDDQQLRELLSVLRRGDYALRHLREAHDVLRASFHGVLDRCEMLLRRGDFRSAMEELSETHPERQRLAPALKAVTESKDAAAALAEVLRATRSLAPPYLETLAVRIDELDRVEEPDAHELSALCSRAVAEILGGKLSEAVRVLERVLGEDVEPQERRRAEGYLKRISEAHATGDDAPVVREFSVEHLAERAGLDPEDAPLVLRLMQEWDPVGCCSRDLRECLLVQGETYGYDDLEVTIIDKHLHNLEKHNYGAIARALSVPVEDVYEAVKQIQKLESRPARDFTDTDDKTIAITPDVYVSREGDKFTVSDNDRGVQRLFINEAFAKRLLKDKATKEFVNEKLRNAQWLIRAIEQRRKTIIRVTECIVEKQREFFERGVGHLKPMILRDVAEELKLHESTISRVTTNKYVHTPQGIFELKYFFNSSIRRVAEEDIASESVKQAIKKLIDGEDKKLPYSDQQLVELLQKTDGIQIARRTVAKYREMLGILSSNKRKKVF